MLILPPYSTHVDTSVNCLKHSYINPLDERDFDNKFYSRRFEPAISSDGTRRHVFLVYYMDSGSSNLQPHTGSLQVVSSRESVFV